MGKIHINRLAGALGAEVSGLDLTKSLSADEFAAIEAAFHEHLVLFFRDQDLTPDQHKGFSALFGELLKLPYIRAVEGHPEIIPIAKGANEKSRKPLAGLWHSDMTYYESPPKASALYARIVPPVGGDTTWSNMYLAYDKLSPGMRAMLESVDAVHSASPSYGPNGDLAFNGNPNHKMDIKSDVSALKEVVHPVVRVHPITGRPALFVNPTYTLRLHDMSDEESAPLLHYLYQHIGRHEFTCRFRWQPHSLAIWDNRCTQHIATHDFDGHERLLHRTTIAGDKPIPLNAGARRNGNG
jgi:taurine dioxygenase